MLRRNNMKKTILALTLTALMGVSLVACGGAGNTPASTQADGDSSVESGDVSNPGEGNDATDAQEDKGDVSYIYTPTDEVFGTLSLSDGSTLNIMGIEGGSEVEVPVNSVAMVVNNNMLTFAITADAPTGDVSYLTEDPSVVSAGATLEDATNKDGEAVQILTVTMDCEADGDTWSQGWTEVYRKLPSGEYLITVDSKNPSNTDLTCNAFANIAK